MVESVLWMALPVTVYGLLAAAVPSPEGPVGLRARLRAVLGRWRRERVPAWPAAAGATLGATQAYGFTVPGDAVPGASPALRLRSGTMAAADTQPGLAEDLWAAADAGLAPDRRHVFLAAPELNAASAGQWYNAVAGRWTDESNELLRLLLGPAGTPAERAAVATQVLSADADAVVIVRPQERAELAGLVGPDLAPRVVSW